jgi:hypothetical protein
MPAPAHIWRCFDPASAGDIMKKEIIAKIKTMDANFFHIKDPSFRVYLSFSHLFRRKEWRTYSMGSRK